MGKYQGEAVCHNCEQPLDWTPEQLMPGAYYVCSVCEPVLLAQGAMVRVEEFFGEWDVFTEDGTPVEIIAG